MARGPGPGTLLFVVCCLELMVVDAGQSEISIVLTPRNYIHPRARDDFVCGLDKTVDPEKLLAELNSEYLIQQLDNTADPDTDYQTLVSDAATFTADGGLFTVPSLCNGNCTGLFSLILIPPTRKCYSNLFNDARVLREGYYVMYLGDGESIAEAFTKYESQAVNLKEHYSGKIPHLCTIRSSMSNAVATSRIKTFTTLFNFPLDSDARTLASQDLKCLNGSETELSFAYLGLFDFTPSEFLFENTNTIVAEDTHNFETNITRNSKSVVGVALVETTLEAGAGGISADLKDLVPYNGPVVFISGENIATLQTQIKTDDEFEPDEVFSISFKSISQRNKRQAGKVLGKKQKITITNVPTTLKHNEVWKWKRSIRTVEKFFYESDFCSTMEDVLKVWTKKNELYNGPPIQTGETPSDSDKEICEILPTGFLWQGTKVTTAAEYMKPFTTKPEGFEDLPEDTDAYRELKEKHDRSLRIFDNMYLPCLLQNILLHEQETKCYWEDDLKFESHSEMHKLYRVTHAKYLSSELDLDVKKGQEEVRTKKTVEIKNFINFASGCDSNEGQCMTRGKAALKYLTQDEFPKEGFFGTYDTGLVVTKMKKTGAKNIREFNLYRDTIPLGQREALFPVGTLLKVTKFTDNGQTDPVMGTPRYEFELEEEPSLIEDEIRKKTKKKAKKPLE